MIRKNHGILVFAAAASCVSAASANIFTLRDIVLEGSQVVPSVDTDGHGMVDITVDTDTRLVTIDGWYADMSSDVFGAHLHGGAGPGENSPAVYIVLTQTGGTSGTLFGSRRLLIAQMETFMADRTYINVHTDNFQDGEIRGQVFVPAPAGGAVLAVFCGLQWRRRRRTA